MADTGIEKKDNAYVAKGNNTEQGLLSWFLNGPMKGEDIEGMMQEGISKRIL